MHQLFLCKFKGREFLNISPAEKIAAKINQSKPENWSEFETYLRRDDPPRYNEYFAELLVESVSADEKNFDSLAISSYRSKILETSLYEELEMLKIEDISFLESLLDIEFPKNVFDVKCLYCSGKSTKGIINFKKYTMLEEIHILDFNKGIKFEHYSNSIKHITLWYFNPTNRSIKILIDAFPNVEEILIHHTNVESLEGIENLKNLQSIHIDYGRNLKFVGALNQCKNAKKITFNNCRKVEDFDKIDKVPERIVENFRLPG